MPPSDFAERVFSSVEDIVRTRPGRLRRALGLARIDPGAQSPNGISSGVGIENVIRGRLALLVTGAGADYSVGTTTAAVDAANLAGELYITGNRPVLIRATCIAQAPASNTLIIYAYVDETNLGEVGKTQSATWEQVCSFLEIEAGAIPPGPHRFSLRAVVSGGTGTIYAQGSNRVTMTVIED